jgi:hypothetical protein
MVDISNAFNTCQRPRLLTALFDTPQLATLLIPQCKGAVDESRFLQSANGVRQGDPLSSLLFCLYLKTALDALSAEAAFGSRIRVYAYVDDVHIVGEVDDVLAAHTAFIQHLQNIDLAVNAAKYSFIYFHGATHPLTAEQTVSVRALSDADYADSAELLGAIIGVSAAAIADRLQHQLQGVEGLFGTFFRRVQSGGFSVQAAMLLLSHSVGRLSYMLRCLPVAAMEAVAAEWDKRMLLAAATVLDLAEHEQADVAVSDSLQRPRRLGGFGLASAALVSPFAFLASVAVSAAQPGEHALSTAALPAASLLHQWLHAALTSTAVTDVQQNSPVVALHTDAGTFTGHYHSQPRQAATLQSKLTPAATNLQYNARVSEVRRTGNRQALARLHGGKAAYNNSQQTPLTAEVEGGEEKRWSECRGSI